MAAMLASHVSRFAPPLGLMAVIFALSAQPDLNSGFGTWDTILRKLAHAAEYGLLWFLWWRALGYGRPWPAATVALLYAASDEYHQTFIEGRVGTPRDWVIDAAGVALAVGAAARWRRSSRQPARSDA